MVGAGRVDGGEAFSVSETMKLRRSSGLSRRSTSPAFSSWSTRLVMVPEVIIIVAERSPGDSA